MPPPNSELSVALATLLQGPVYAEDSPAVWASVSSLGSQLRDHLNALGMRLVVDTTEQYAYLRADDELPDGMPRLVRRHALSYSTTVLLILLRQQLTSAEADADTQRLIVTTEQIVEMMRLYHPPGTSDEKIATDIARLAELGYLKRMRSTEDTWEVRRIIKGSVTADWISEWGEKLLRQRPDAQTADEALDESLVVDLPGEERVQA
jgi:hypothetical protein